MKQHRDKVFLAVMGITLAMLALHFTTAIVVRSWFLAAANLVAIWGVLWLLRSYRRMVKNAKTDSYLKKDI